MMIDVGSDQTMFFAQLCAAVRGAWISMAHSAGRRVIGIDISTNKVHMTRTAAGDNISLFTGNGSPDEHYQNSGNGCSADVND